MLIINKKNKYTSCFHCLINDTTDYLLYWHTQKKRLISTKINCYKKGCMKKCSFFSYLPLTTVINMSAFVETSFFHPKNVRIFNSKVGWAAGMSQTIS